jgi:DNA-binding PadR family transcriptional regulator
MNAEPYRQTIPTNMILGTMADGKERYGGEIARMTGLRPASVYAILYRLYSRGFLLDRWENVATLRGPRKRYWRLNPENPLPTELEQLRAENLVLKRQLREKSTAQVALAEEFHSLVDEVRKGLVEK